MALFKCLILFCLFITYVYSALNNKLYVNKLTQPSQLLSTFIETFPSLEIEYYTNITQIFTNAPSGSSILYLSDTYPNKLNPITASDYALWESKMFRLYIEYPLCIKFALNTSCTTDFSVTIAGFDRAIVTDIVNNQNNNLTIIDMHQLYRINLYNYVADKNLVMFSKVAGYYYALYGIDNPPPTSLIYELNTMISCMTTLNNYAQSRFTPYTTFQYVLKYIINFIIQPQPPVNITDIKWAQTHIIPTHNKKEAMNNSRQIPTTNELKQSLQKGIKWVFNSNLLVNENDWNNYNNWNAGSGSRYTPDINNTKGNGTYGIFEGFTSQINATGGQNQSIIIRTDCNGEIAGALAWGAKILNNTQYSTVAYNLLHFIYDFSVAQTHSNLVCETSDKQVYTNATCPTFGILLWGVNAAGWTTKFYCDDNSRGLLHHMMVLSLLPNTQIESYIEKFIWGVLANYRLTSTAGCCLSSGVLSSINSKGWEYYFTSTYYRADPHYVSWIWPIYLWTCNNTNYTLMCDRTITGIGNMMNAYYKNELYWANGLTQEYSRMMLPLAFLHRIYPNNGTFKKWLYDMGYQLEYYLLQSDPFGGIEEHYGNLSYGSARPPQNNAQYGTSEAPLEQENGDPVTDSLYTMPFAIWGYWEAYKVTNDVWFQNQVYELLNYVFDIQIKVETNSSDQYDKFFYLDGGWFRAHDFNLWEYYASASDTGWGPWSIESGWTVGEYLSTFAMIIEDKSFFDYVTLDQMPNFNQLFYKNLQDFKLPPYNDKELFEKLYKDKHSVEIKDQLNNLHL